MNQRTLEKLKKNPHYKISAKQYAEPMTDEGQMVEIGKVPRHNNTFQTHNTQMRRVERTGQNE